MAITLLSAINGSSFYAEYAASALKDSNGNVITATYQTTADMTNYPTIQNVADSIANLSGTIDASAFATQTYVDTEIGKIGAYVTANSAAGGVPAVDNPNTKTIYLVKDTSAPGTDKWKEWIVTATSPVGWELIGDTSMSLNGYATETWVGDNYVSKTSTAGWDVTPYTGDDGIEVSNNVISISANYLSANALDSITGVSANWNSAAQAIETSGTTWNGKQDALTNEQLSAISSVSGKQDALTNEQLSAISSVSGILDTLTFTYATIG